MKKIIILLVCLGFSLAGSAQHGKTFTLTGDVSKVNQQYQKVFIIYTVNGETVRDSVDVKKGKYVFKGKIETPVIATLEAIPVNLSTDPSVLMLNDLFHEINFYLEPNKHMTVVHGPNFYDKKSTGSITEKELEHFEATLAPLEAMNRKFMPEFMKEYSTNPSDPAKIHAYTIRGEELAKSRRKAILDYTSHHLQSPIVLHLFNRIYETNDEGILAQWFTKIPQNIKLSKEGKEFKQKMKLLIGNPAPDFTQPDTSRNPVTLSSFRGKYVLVDFWASWCHPCREEKPTVVKAFKKFKDKNFMVLSVSLDNDSKPWLEAIQTDGLNLAGWIHVSDLTNNNQVAKLYGVFGIPANVLIDPNGKVVAKNIQGEELDEILSKLIK